MGLEATEKKQTLLDAWSPFLTDMSKTVGLPISGVVADDYAGVIWLLGADKAQLGWVGNKAAIEAVDRAGCQVLARVITPFGSGYYSHLITQAQSPLQNETDMLRQAKTLIFGNGDPNSTSGTLVPGYYIFAANGTSPRKSFKRMTTQNHEANFHAVAAGAVDVATSNSSALARYKAKYPDEYKKIKVIWTSPLIPSDPIVVRSDMAPATKHAILAFLVNAGKATPGKDSAQLAREKQFLTARKWTGFEASDNRQLIPIRKLKLFKTRTAIENNDSLSTAQRAEQLHRIDQEFNKLEHAQ